MVRYLTDADIRACLCMERAIMAVEVALHSLAAGQAAQGRRQRVKMPAGPVTMHLLGSASNQELGLKVFTTGAGGAKSWMLLFGESGQLLSILDASVMGQIRTGAATGVATRCLARPAARVLAQLGSGWQAQGQLEAVCRVRPIERALVWSRDAQRLDRFCRSMSARLGLPVQPADSPQAAVAQADVVNVTTSAQAPVLLGEWLRPGVHVNAAGNNRPDCREVDGVTVGRADQVVVDLLEQAMGESGELILAAAEGLFAWERAVQLDQVVTGRRPGRGGDREITLFKSNGVAIWDLAVAREVFELACRAGVGTPLPMDPEASVHVRNM